MAGVFTFEADTHTYATETGEVPGITRLLHLAGLVDDTWYTEESSERGRHVHQLCAEYDLGVITDEDLPDLVSAYKGYLLAHIESMRVVRPHWIHVETATFHEQLRFAGTPDRAGTVYNAAAVWEIKSGLKTKAHPIQTALQAFLIAEECKLPPEAVERWCCYVQPNGRCKIEQHGNRRDFVEALGIVRKYAA
jgi:hypothetical protein